MKKTEVKSFVKQLLIDNAIVKIPTPLEHIATLINAEVKYSNLSGAELSGFAYNKDNLKVIGVNRTESPERQRFTIAHELGHLFLHDNLSLNYDQGGVMMFRNGHSSEGKDLREIEANTFAAELLMPESTLRSDLAQEGAIDLINDMGLIARLATKYQVSVTAMSIRLATLYFN